VHRPLFSFTKGEIKNAAERIGTYDGSYKGQEFCALATKKVTTGASYKELMQALPGSELEERMKEAIESRILWDLNTKGELEAREPGFKHREKEKRSNKKELDASSADHVIDLRTDDEIAESDMPVQGERIPFEQAMEDYFHWDRSASYFFICNYGSKSRIIAHYMEKEGFEAAHSEGGAIKHEAP
jgi:rhodanese-related sulfurtransferase